MSDAAPLVDLDGDSRSALEFDDLLAWVASLARTAPGARRVLARAPRFDPEHTRSDLAACAEVRRHLEASGTLLAGRIPDPHAALEALGVGGLVLEPPALRDLASTVSAVSDLGRELRRLAPAEYPWLAGTGRGIPDLAAECKVIVRGIEPEGRIKDDASRELGRIRLALARGGERLRRTLERLVRAPGLQTSLSDDFITQRNGRFVVPLRAGAARPLSGIVHASSSSGATQFVEPLETVELNNDLVRLAEEEREEERRLLREWCDRLRGRLPELSLIERALAEIDDAQARALFAEECGAITPLLAAGGTLLVREARHPLLDRRLRAQGAGAVPVDLELDPPDQVLVVSGPNAGGKTVVSKTLGLFVLMAQSGIPLPAREVRLPLYRQVRVDIGDHQSIQADLSTFSAHVRAIARFLEEAQAPALFLFDEIGTGTEPGEGAALARAVLESLAGRGITAVATTHFGELKAWAAGGGSAACAAMEFDRVKLQPTFRIVMGATGASAGLEIARRGGLPETILARAAEHLGPEARRREEYLKRLAELIAAREAELAALALERRALGAAKDALLSRHAREREDWLKRSAAHLERITDEIRERGRRELGSLTDAKERRRLERRWDRTAGELRGEVARFKSESAGEAPQAADEPAPAELVPGLRVRLLSLAREGEVLEARGERVRVRVGEMVIDSERSDLRPAAAQAGGASETLRPRSAPQGRDRPRAGRELELLGRTAAEAEDDLDKFLDAALLAGHDEVRIIHGHGTGRLRAAVRRQLAAHPLVAAHRAARPEEGGDGATIVTLA